MVQPFSLASLCENGKEELPSLSLNAAIFFQSTISAVVIRFGSWWAPAAWRNQTVYFLCKDKCSATDLVLLYPVFLVIDCYYSVNVFYRFFKALFPIPSYFNNFNMMFL